MSVHSWAGKRVWVIGASSGIGLACAQLLQREGAWVALSARRQALLDQLCHGLPHTLALAADVRERASLGRACASILAQWQCIDLVILAAGDYETIFITTGKPMDAASFELETAQALLDLNVGGAYRCLDVVLPVLRRQAHGAFAVIASAAGWSGLPRALAYGPGKAALINLCECLHLELAPQGISVHLVNPGFVATPLTAANDFPMPGLMQPDDAARALVDGLARGQFHIHFPRRFTNWLRFARLLPYPLYFWFVRKITGP